MHVIKPRFPSDGSYARPSKKAVLTEQGIDTDFVTGTIMATQTWLEPDGTELVVEIRVDDNMLEGEAVSVSVNAPGNNWNTSFACSGVISITVPSRFSGASGVFGGNPKPAGPTMQEVEDGTKPQVEGMDYDFSDTGIMKKKGSMDDK